MSKMNLHFIFCAWKEVFYVDNPTASFNMGTCRGQSP